MTARLAALTGSLLRLLLGVAYLARSVLLNYIELSVPGGAELVRTVRFEDWAAYARLWAEHSADAVLAGGAERFASNDDARRPAREARCG